VLFKEFATYAISVEGSKQIAESLPSTCVD